jgi:hypothetical protein
MDICTSMALERKGLEKVMAQVDIRSQSDAMAYADALTQLIWNHNLLGLVHEYYDSQAVYKGANGAKISGTPGIVNEFLSMQAAFPDMRVHITETFAAGDEDQGFTVYQRSWCDGTNTGTSKFGPPTGNRLNETNSMGQTVYLFKKIQGRWRISNEFSLRSQPTIDRLLKDQS